MRLGNLEGIAGDGGEFRFHFRVVSVGAFDFDEFDVFHFLVFPLEGDAPRGFPGVCINGVFCASFEAVVVKCGREKEGFFIGLIERDKASEGFDEVKVAEFFEFLAV